MILLLPPRGEADGWQDAGNAAILAAILSPAGRRSTMRDDSSGEPSPIPTATNHNQLRKAMTTNITWTDGELRIVVEGDIDERGAEQLKEQFREWQRHETRQVTVDLGRVNHLGSAGIGKILVLYKDLAARNARLALVNVPGSIYGLLCEMRLNVLFSISKANP